MNHYYGDIVRRYLLTGAIVIAVTLPFFFRQIPEPLWVSIGSIIIICVAAALISPRYIWSAFLSFIVSLAAVATFEYYAVDAYIKQNATSAFFWTNEILALIFVIAFYYSVKTVRGMNNS